MRTEQEIQALTETVQESSKFVQEIYKESSKIIVGQSVMLERLMVGLLTKGHVLLEGLPGLAKTLSIKTLASSVDAEFRRIQFTPDLLPADILGTMIYNPASSDFEIRKGPIFANFILADEINRAPAKVQSALLESMQERQVTIGKTSFNLEEPFLVLATQNPIEQEGTYPLPEAQVDRFMLKVKIDYPQMEEEREIIRRTLSGKTSQLPNRIVRPDKIIEARKVVRQIYMDENIEQYILDLVFASRDPKSFNLDSLQPYIEYGGSPRASINLALASKAIAYISGRAYVIPDDVRMISRDVMRHRIGLTYEAEAESIDQDDILDQLLQGVQVP